jgi:hypothetical protein
MAYGELSRLAKWVEGLKKKRGASLIRREREAT